MLVVVTGHWAGALMLILASSSRASTHDPPCEQRPEGMKASAESSRRGHGEAACFSHCRG